MSVSLSLSVVGEWGGGGGVCLEGSQERGEGGEGGQGGGEGGGVTMKSGFFTEIEKENKTSLFLARLCVAVVVLPFVVVVVVVKYRPTRYI